MSVGRVIALFTAMGCELRPLTGRLSGPDGSEPIRFLYNPETEGVASLSTYDDDDRIPPSQIDQWERALGVEIPRGPSPH